MSMYGNRVNLKLAPNRMVGSEFKIVGKRIGAGNFGEVRLGENVVTGEKVAVKIERIVNPKGASATVRLRHEYDMLRRLYHGFPRGHKINGIPKIHYFGKCGQLDCMVIELLGANLEDLFELVGSQFSLKTVLMIAFQLLDRIEQVHQRGLVYRDIKPENFLLGRKDCKMSNIIHLVDFGLATFYRDPVTGRHLPYKDTKTMTGTARYMSVHSHLGKLQSRRDDLESIGYVLIYFAKGSLPWQGFKTTNLKEKYKKIRDAKMRYPVHVLCDGLPPQFATYMHYVKKMAFGDEPDYEYLKDLFHEVYEEMGYSYDDTDFDWSCLDIPNDVQKFNQANRDGEEAVSSLDTDVASHHIEDEAEGGESIFDCKRKASENTLSREGDDGLGELRNIRDQKKAMDGLVNSRWNVKSLSVSNSHAGLESVTEVANDDRQFELSAVGRGVLAGGGGKALLNYGGSQSNSQGYFSNSEIGSEKAAPSSAAIPRSSSAGAIASRTAGGGLKELAAPPGAAATERRNSATLSKCHCTEACYIEEKFSFLCFSWRKKKKDVTYHGYRDGEECKIHSEDETKLN